MPSSRITRSRDSRLSLNDNSNESSPSTRETSPFHDGGSMSTTSSPAATPKRKRSLASSNMSEPVTSRKRDTRSSAFQLKNHNTDLKEIEIKISSDSDTSISLTAPKRNRPSRHSVSTRPQRSPSEDDIIKIDSSSSSVSSSKSDDEDEEKPSRSVKPPQRNLRGRGRFRVSDDSGQEQQKTKVEEKRKTTNARSSSTNHVESVDDDINVSGSDEFDQEDKRKRRRLRGGSGEPKPARLRRRRKSSSSSSSCSTNTASTRDMKKTGNKKDLDRKNKKEEDDAEEAVEGGENGDGEEWEDGKKGRKKIRKILKDKKLSSETKNAEALERERRKRLEERQKFYNKNVLVEAGEGALTTTSRLVLDFQKNSEEPLIEVHSDLVKHLKPHQVQAVRFLYDNVIESVEEHKTNKDRLSGAILAHCMGLGKSLSTITFVHTLLTHPDILGLRSCLIICPVNTLLNWHREWRHWMPEDGTELAVYELATAAANNFRMDVIKRWHSEGGVMLMGYDMYRNLTTTLLKKTRKPTLKRLIPAALIDPGPDIVVCDEGHLLKNCKTGVTKAINSLKTPKRVILTGTPLQNNLAEYWTMVNFVKPNLLGSAREFANRFVNPIKNGQHSNSTTRDVQLMKKRAHVLFKTLDGCVQRRDYSCLTQYLPPRLEYILKIRLSEVQCDFYRSFLQHRQERGTLSAAAASEDYRRNTLFRDQQTLYRVWTHPHTLRMHETREAKRLLLQESTTEDEEDESDDDDVDDSGDVEEEEEEAASVVEGYSSSSSASSASGSIGSVTTASGVAKTNNKGSSEFSARATRANRRRQLRHNESSTMGRGLDSGSTIDLLSDCGENNSNTAVPRVSSGLLENGETSNSVDTTAATDKPWWYPLYRDEYDLRIDVGSKLNVLFFLLKKCSEIGDKVLVFSQSLFSLDLIEWFLAALDRQWCMSQGLEVDTNSKQAEEFQKLQQLDTFEMPSLVEYFSDMDRNTWRRGKDYERIDGSLNAVQRNTLQTRFNSPSQRFRLLIISTKAGGLGVNLTAANRLVIFDVSWNPSHDIQSIFRSYRFGQTKPVYIYRLVAQGTMEEKMYDRQVTKQSLALRVIDEQQICRHFKEEDLRELYTFDPEPWDAELAATRPPPSMPPKDRLLADLLSEKPSLVASYHDHDSLLENRLDEGLSEAERAEAWREYEEEKRVGRPMTEYQRLLLNNPEAAMLLLEQRRRVEQQNEEEQRRRMTAMANAYAAAAAAAAVTSLGMSGGVGGPAVGPSSTMGYTSVNPTPTDTVDSMFRAIPAGLHHALGGIYNRPQPLPQRAFAVAPKPPVLRALLPKTDVFSESFNAMRAMLLSRYPQLARSPATLHDMTMRLFVNSVANQVAAQAAAVNSVTASSSSSAAASDPSTTNTHPNAAGPSDGA